MQTLQPRQLLQRNHMLRINSYPRETGRQFFGFDPWLSFLLRWYLSLKIWVKPLVSRRSISHRLLCVPFFISTVQRLGSGVRWILLIFDLKLVFCLGGNFTTFPKTILIEKFCFHMTPKSRDIFIFVTWSKFCISKMWRQQNCKF